MTILDQLSEEIAKHKDVEEIHVVPWQPRGEVLYLCAAIEHSFTEPEPKRIPAHINVNPTDFLEAAARADKYMFVQLNDDISDHRMKEALGLPVVYE